MTPITQQKIAEQRLDAMRKKRLSTLSDLISLFLLFALLIVMFGASFQDGECEAETRPMICIPVYHFFQSEK